MLKKSWLLLVLLSSALPNVNAAGFTAAGVQDRIIIAFQPGASASEQRAIAEAQGLTVLDEIPEMRVLLVRAQPGRVRMASANLASNSKVLRADQDVWINWLKSEPVSFAQMPMPTFDSVFHALPKLRRQAVEVPAAPAVAEEVQWGVARLNAPAAWPTNQGAGVNVAIVDTGIDPAHPELTGKIRGGFNALNKGASWADDHSHGTHVAGIVAATLDNAGVVGVAPKANLYAVKVLTKDGGGSLFSILDGINWCAKQKNENKIHVLNMSLGAPQEFPLLQLALQQAVAAGVTIVAAAGNDGKEVNWPAAYPESIAVSALCPPGVTETRLCPNDQEGIATFSSRGDKVEFIAPGVNVLSSVLGGGLKAYSGTSMASPHVAGLAALAVARGARGPDAVRAALKAAAQRLPDLSDEEQGFGVINAAKLK